MDRACNAVKQKSLWSEPSSVVGALQVIETQRKLQTSLAIEKSLDCIGKKNERAGSRRHSEMLDPTIKLKFGIVQIWHSVRHASIVRLILASSIAFVVVVCGTGRDSCRRIEFVV
jgi:hypothetical protein